MLVTGVIWLFDSLFLVGGRRRRSANGGSSREPILVEYAKSFFPILVLVVVLRSFLFEPFRIPSGSMMPTLLQGDFIFVNKFAYGLRLPVINSRIVEIGEPQRGDVVVFRLPSDPSINYIKRVVGLPGDVVEYDPGPKRLTINGEPVPVELIGDYMDNPSVVLALETLGDSQHSLLTMNRQSRGGIYEVPAGHYFCMGDNRDDSTDSRFPSVGYVPEGNLVGRAVRIWMNWRNPSQGGPRWGRIGMKIE
jgi:signal peptidase I